jgi:hypothetical protein
MDPPAKKPMLIGASVGTNNLGGVDDPPDLDVASVADVDSLRHCAGEHDCLSTFRRHLLVAAWALDDGQKGGILLSQCHATLPLNCPIRLGPS